MNETLDRSREWSLARRIGFRFLFSYLVLYNIPEAGSASLLSSGGQISALV
jgi:hypothetical protein